VRTSTLLLLAALLWGVSALVRPPTRQQELRVLVTARNMVTSGDWLHPEFQNQPRYRKPPLAYWAAAAGFTLTRNFTSAWAGRLLFVAFAVGGLYVFRTLAGESSALLLLFSYGSLVYGPLAETDFLQLTGLILAVWGWRTSRGWSAGAGIAMACLAKGPGGLAIPLVTYLLLLPVHRPPLRFWIPALLLPLLCAGGWIGFLLNDPIAAAALKQELSDTFVDTAHRNPPPYYLWTLPLLLLPSGLLVFRARKSTPETRKPDARIAATWFWATLLLLTFTVSKQRHYALMLLPPTCWWLGVRLWDWRPKTVHVVVAAKLAAILILVLAMIDPETRTARFLNRVRPRVAGANTLHVVGINSARFDFHLGRHVDNLDSAQAALTRANPGESVVVVQKQKYWDAENSSLTPTHSADDADWIRRVYRMPASE